MTAETAFPPSWRNFNKYWLSQSVAQVAGQILTLGYPLIAIEVLGLGPLQASLTTTLQFLPYLLMTPIAGALVDRVPRLKLIFVCHGVRAILLAICGLLLGFDLLTTGFFWALVVISGALNATASVGTMALVPDIAPEGGIAKANSRLQLSMSLAQVLGPAAAGLLVAWVGGGIFVAIAVIFALAAISIMRTSARTLLTPPSGHASWFESIRAGFRFVWNTPVLNALLVQMTLFNFFEQAVITLFVLFSLNELGLGPAQVGIAIGMGALGSVLGATIAGRFTGTSGGNNTMVWATGVASIAPFGLILVPVGAEYVAVTVSGLIFCLYGVGLTVFNIHSNTLRHELAAQGMQGRLASVFRTSAFSSLALGAAAAGLLAELLPYRVAILISCSGLAVAFLIFAVRMNRLK